MTIRSLCSLLSPTRVLSSVLAVAVLLPGLMWQEPAQAYELPWQRGKASTLGSRVEASRATKGIHIQGATANDPRVSGVIAIVSKMLAAANSHNLDAFMAFYANGFHSGDNLSRQELRGLIQETWEQYPSIQYDSEIVEIRVNGNWITVESEDTSIARNIEPPGAMVPLNAPPRPSDYGTLKTRARNLMYLHKVGDYWLIESDQSLYEDAELRYGNTDGLLLELSVPDKVFAEQSYTAAIEAAFPNNSVGMTTINQSQMTFPHPKVKNAMRVVAPRQNRLERVFIANSNHRNEMISMTLGLLKANEAVVEGERTVGLELAGVLTLVKRVNVASKSSPLEEVAASGLVNYAANGKIDLRKMAEDQAKALEMEDGGE
jgi:hypothetical protein